MPPKSPFPPSLPVSSVVRPVSEGGRRVLDLVMKKGSLSQADITRSLDLAQPTVTRLVQGFHQDGLVLIGDSQMEGRPGKPSANVSLNPDFAYSLGVALMGDVVSMTLMDFSGAIRGRRRTAMPGMKRAAVTASLRQFMEELIAESTIDRRRLVGVGVGFSGYYLNDSKLFNPKADLEDWALVDIEQILADVLGLPVTADNCGTVAAIGESLFGVGQRSPNFAYLHLSNGFGGGLITDGRPQRGVNGNAGEFGGVWAALPFLSYTNLEMLQDLLREHGRPFATVEDMVNAIDLATPGVDVWLERAAPSFTLLCSIITSVIDPGIIVIGGRLPHDIARELAGRVAPILGNRRGHPPPTSRVVAAEAPSEPVSLGAAVMPFRNAFFL